MGKKKLIHTNQHGFLKCDNIFCDYILDKKDENRTHESYINEPCPECGENLLTQEDYHRFQKVMKVINWINKWFGWLGTYVDNPKNERIAGIDTHQSIRFIKE